MNEYFGKWKTCLVEIAVLTAISALVFFPALGQNRHWANREIRHAEIIREMAANNDYLIPRLMGEVYHDKPPVMHAAAAVLTRIVGTPGMAIARIPSALAGMLGILAIYGIGRLLLDRRAALLAAIILLGIPGYGIMARQARPDMILCASSLLSCLCLGLGMKERREGYRTLYFVLGGLLAGLGVVTKGPYGIVVPAFFAALAPIRNSSLMRPRFNWSSFVLGCLAAIALWAIPAYLRDGGNYLRGVVLQPDLDVVKGRSGKPVFWYLWYIITLTFPYSLFLPLGIIDLRRRGYSAPLAIVGAVFLVISCIPKKRPHYLVPLYPFFALGIADALVYRIGTSRFVRRAALILVPLSLVAIPVYFVAVQPFTHPYKNSPMFFAKEVLRTAGTESRIYCESGFEEALAWTGRRHTGIHKFSCSDPSSLVQILREAEAGTYLVISEKHLVSLMEDVNAVRGERILNGKVGRENMMLFRLSGNESGPP